jgi:hypothetical protein
MTRKSCLPLAATLGPVIFTCLTAGCQTKPAAPSEAAAPVQLQTYTAPDQSASAGVPAGWQATSGSQTVIQMAGPQGATVVLGNTAIAKNAAFQLGQKPGNGVDLSMPYSATLGQKLGMIFQQSAAAAGAPAAQLTVDSTTPLQLPATIGQCARFVADFTGAKGATKMMAVFCSLPLDSAGIYKNIMLVAEASPAVAAQLAPTAQAIFQSYRIPATWLQKKLAPFTAPPMAAATANAEAAMINRETMQSAAAVSNSANCFDLTVLRQTPTYQLPRSCGGTMPD